MEEFKPLDVDDSEIDALAKQLLTNAPNDKSNLPAMTLTQNTPLNKDKKIEDFLNDSIQTTDKTLSKIIARVANDATDVDTMLAIATILKGKNDNLKMLNDQLNKNRANATKIKIKTIDKQGDIINTSLAQGKSVITSRDEIFKEILKETEETEEEEDDGDEIVVEEEESDD